MGKWSMPLDFSINYGQGTSNFEKWLLSLIVQSPEISCDNCIHCKQDEVCERWNNPNKTDEYCYSGIYQKYLKEVNYGNERK